VPREREEHKSEASTPSQAPITMARVQLAAQMANALQNSDSSSDSDESLDAGYVTPNTDAWSEPERNPSTDDCNREYELKVREHQHAIRKAYPRVFFPDATKAELVSKFQDYLETMERRHGAGFYDKAVRQMAEQHVRWQARPKQAYHLIVRDIATRWDQI